ncbi:hypothetical protein DIZ27_06655 [Streptomyces sp. NWU339]|uniref:WXG100 family type VII secretion target n=1 Tax=Streptomyces sp. NWU339 TaxID=2185284 RepID=UPI000D6729FD|nr:WXG100 family type VII secretion target [Streptomyces sp. NWU339]PWI11086.1 hypothetical protein DIZ27_06655 [Streptomyces sp. NWU339]
MTDEQHEQDLERVSGQNSFTDLTRHAEEHPSSGFLRGAIDSMVRAAAEKTPYGRAMHGRTNFDEHRLNDMIDLVEKTNPEDMEASGKALWDARDAISDAAKELDGRIEKVHWVGESGEAFRKWGRSLVISTYGLSDFAGGAGDQISAAAVGLAAVRGSMPLRDTRPTEKALRPEQMPTPKQVEGNAEYAEAVRVEKDRQEAINQMNRLSSYYAVAREQLVELKSPEFKAMPDVGVPRPTPGVVDTDSAQGGGASAAAHQATGATGSASHQPAVAQAERGEIRGAKDVPLRPVDSSRPPAEPDIAVGTTIDSVGTLPPLTPSIPGDVAPTVGAPGGSSSANNGFANGYGTPVGNMISRKGTSGSGGLRGPVSAQGRTGAAGVNNMSPGRPGNGPVGQMGRTAATGQSIAKGVPSGAKSLPMGSGVAGGTAKPTGTSGPRPQSGGTTGAGHANGVVGGRPVTGAATPAKNGPRIPRGTVIGTEAAAGSRSAAERRPGQGGVFGGLASAGKPGSAANSPRVGPATSGAITGSPAARNSAVNAERNGMTRGGAGLVRGPGGRGRPDKTSDKDREETARGAHLSEDEELHLPTQQRRGVPPVVN